MNGPSTLVIVVKKGENDSKGVQKIESEYQINPAKHYVGIIQNSGFNIFLNTSSNLTNNQ